MRWKIVPPNVREPTPSPGLARFGISARQQAQSLQRRAAHTGWQARASRNALRHGFAIAIHRQPMPRSHIEHFSHEVLKSVAGDKAASAIEKRLFAPGRAADCSPWSGDTLAILLACRHGARAPELVTGRSEVGANRLIDFKSATLHVRRVKNGTPASPKAGSRAFGGIRPGWR
jgi:hypothetical protein